MHCLTIGLLTILLAVGNMAFGAVRIASVSGNWNSTTTWGGLSVPNNTDDITINAGITVTMNVNGTCRTITDMAGGSISGGSRLTIAGNAGIAITNISGTANIACRVAMPASGSITVTGSLTISGVISGAAINLSKNGIGILILSAANTYTGSTTVLAGILNIRNNSATGTVAGGVTVQSGARLELEGTNLMISEALSLSGEGDGITEGALYNVSGNNMWSGPISIDGAITRINSAFGDLILNTIDLKGNLLTIQGGSTDALIAGVISSSVGSGSITKTGAGAWTLSGSNTFSGGVTLSEGTLNINNNQALGTIAGTFTIGGAGNAVVIDNTTVSAITLLNYPQAWDDDFTFTGSSALNLGTGTVTMSNSRQVTVTASILTIGGIINQTTLDLTKAGSGELAFNNQALALNSLIINDGTLTSTSGSLNLAGNFSNNGTFNHNSGTVLFGGISVQNIGGTQETTFNNLTLDNTSGATLGNSGTLEGTLTLTSGRLILGSNNITLGATAVAGTPSVSNMIVADGTGECRRVFAADGSYVFPVGDETGIPEYSPITLNFTSGTYSSAYAAIRVTDGQHPDDLSPSDFISRYWSVTQSGISSFAYDAEGTFSAADINGNLANIITGMWYGSVWQNLNPVTATTISASGVTSSADFTGISSAASPISVTIAANPGLTVCKDVPLTLTANPVGDTISSYLWSPNGETTPSINPSTAIPGSILYTVTVTDINGFTATNNVSVTVDSSLLATATPSSDTICTGTAPSIALTSNITGTTYLWTVVESGVTGASDGSGAIISQTLTATGSIAGTATYTITPTANGCTGAQITVVITVNPIPDVTATPLSDTICSGTASSIALTSNNAETTFSWTVIESGVSGASDGSGATISQTLDATGIINGTATYIITPTVNGCTGTPVNVVITVNPKPVITATPALQLICSGAAPSIALTSNISGTTFGWTVVQTGVLGASAGSGSLIDQILTTTGTTAGTATYTITPTANGCAGSPITAVITVKPIPVASANPSSQTMCSGSTSIVLSSNITGTTFAYTIENTPAGSITGATSGSGSLIAQTLINTIQLPATVTYTITPTVNSCTGNPVNVIVTVNPSPALSSALTASVCNNTLFNYIPTSNTPLATFTWKRAAVLGIQNLEASGTGAVNETLINTTGLAKIVTYTYTITANSCTRIQNVSVTVYPMPVMLSWLTPSAVCSNSPFTYLPVSSVAGTTFTWDRAVVPGISNPAGSGTGNINETLINTTINDIIVPYVYTMILGSCTNTAVVNATVKSELVLLSTLTPGAICSNTVFSYNPTSPTSGTTFSWSRFPVAGISNGPGFGINNPNETLINITSNPVNVTYIYTLQANGCSYQQNVVVTVNPKPIVNNITNQEYCDGTNTPVISFIGPVSGTSFIWTNNNPSIGLAANGIGDIPSFIATNITSLPVTASITVTPVANGCTGTPVSFTIKVNPTPSADTPANQNICESVVSSAISFTGTFVAISWTNDHPEIGLAASGTGNIGSFTAINPGLNPIVATITAIPHSSVSGTGCDGIPVTFTITVNPTPAVNPIGNETLCTGDNHAGFAFSTTASGGSPVFDWTSSSDVGFGNSGSGSIPAFVSTNGGAVPLNTTVGVIVTMNGCSGGASNFVVVVNPVPTVAQPANQNACNNGTTTTVHFTGTATSYAWTNSNNTIGLGASGTGDISSFTAINNGASPILATITVTPNYTNAGTTCQGTPKSFIITINPSPTSTIAGTTSVCQNAVSPVITFTGANGTPPYTFTYQINGGSNQTITTTSGNSVTLNALTGTSGIFTYKITGVSDINGCFLVQSKTAIVTIEALPTATISGTTTTCQNSVEPLITFIGAGGTLPYTFTYQINGGALQNITTVSGNSISLGAPTNVPGIFTYSLVGVSSSSGCTQSQSGTATVTVNPTPNLVINNPAPVCSPATIDLTASSITAGSAPGLTFTYWTDAAATIAYSTPATAVAGTYYIKGFDPIAGCSTIKPVVATVNPSPALVITNPAPVCAPATVNITLPGITSGSTPGLIYSYWKDAAATLSYPTPTAADDETYYIKGTTALGCFDIEPVTVSVYASLGIPVFAMGASSSICKGSGPVAYTATVSNAFTLTYSLDAASLAGGNTINSATGMVTYAPGWTGTSRITATATGCGAPATAIHTVTINPTPVVSLVASPSTSVCEGTSITLTATNSGGTVLQTVSGASGNINLSIPNYTNTAYSYSTISLSGSGANLGPTDVVKVSLNITHGTDSDLDIFLVDPTGTRAMLLSSDNGGNGNNYTNTVIQTNAANSIATGWASFTGTYLPEGSIVTAPDRSGAAAGGTYNAVIPANALNGAPIDGSWSLRVFDDAGGNSGTLVNWSLSISKQLGSGFTSVVNGPPTIGPVTYSGFSNSTATAVVIPPAGTQTYTVTTTDALGCSATSNVVTLVIKPAPVPTITADYCTFRPKVRITTPTCTSCLYAWNTGATSNSMDVDIAGKYTVNVTYSNGCINTSSIQVADELVTNGDFSAGNSGFTTGYTYTANIAGQGELYPEGFYGIGTSAYDYHDHFHGRDHTTGSGNFMIINGSTTSPIKTIWQETVTVVPNTDYYFSAWAMNVNPTSPARLQFEVNGVLVGSVADLSTAPKPAVEGDVAISNWVRFYSTPMWNSGALTTAIIRIRNLNMDPQGNDFGLDDISFGTLVNTPFSISASSNSPVGSPICSRDTLKLSSTITGGRPPLVYTWAGPNSYLSHLANPAIASIPPTASGSYILSVVDFYNCPAEIDTAVVLLNPTPEIPDKTELICSSSSFDATPLNGVPNASTFVPAGTTYSWPAPIISPAGSVTGTSADAGQTTISQLLINTTNLPATVTYTVTPVAGSCTGKTFKVIVIVNSEATANAGNNQEICAGITVQLNGSVGGAATTGNWSGGTGAFNPNRNALNAIYTPSASEVAAGTITLDLISNDPDGAGPCSSAVDTVQITINALPVLSSTVVNIDCYGASTGSVDLTVTGGVPVYTYAWTASNGGVVPPGQVNSQDLSGLVAGTYTVAVNDTKTCGATLSLVLTEPSLLVASESHSTVPCSITATSVTITATGGTAPYTGTGIFAQSAGTTLYSVTDANGCTASVSATVIADPNSAPVITTCPVTRNYNGCSTADISGPAFSTLVANSSYAEFSSATNKGVASDNCVITTVTYQDITSSSCPILVTRTWTVGDASGLYTSCQQSITVSDVSAPAWTTAAGILNRSIECNDAVGLANAQVLIPVASDGCDTDVTNIVKTANPFVSSPGCTQSGSYTNTWKVTDNCGNISATYTQVITITDNTAPVWVTAAGSLDQTVECSDIVGLISAQALQPVALDQCDNNVTNIIKVAGPLITGTCGHEGTYTNTWTVSDDCGNVSSVFTQVITITDNSSPVWVIAAGALDRSVECSNAAGLAAIQALYPIAWDNCASDVSNIIKTSGPFVPSATCALEGTYTNTWIVSDDCGNTSDIYSQVITIEDNTDPVILCPPSDAYSCDSPSFDPSVTGFAVASSDCSATPVLAWADAIIPGGCAGNYQIIRTWTATNICGNTNSCAQTIFVQDVTPPAVTCTVSGNQDIYTNPGNPYIHPDNAWDATATDNCSGETLTVSLSGATISGPLSSLNGVTFDEGLTTVTWTATDGCGISSDCTFTVTVIIKPEINCLADISVNNDPNLCSSVLDPGFPTLVYGSAPITYSWVMTGATSGSGTGPIGNHTFNKGITSISWTATNAAGSDACIQTMTVIDNQAPVTSVPADKIYCVQDILTASYFDPTTDITPTRPDYFTFEAGNTDLNLNPATFSDNCPASCVFEIRWRIDFQDGTFIPALPATYITGQPSTYGTGIQFPGNVTLSVIHKITYQVVDCSGNISAAKSVNITINPRPNVIKLN